MTILKNNIYNFVSKYLIKDLTNLLYLYLHTIEIKTYNTNIQDCKFIDDNLPNFTNLFPMMLIHSMFDKITYDFKFLIYEDLYIDSILCTRKIYWDSHKIKNIGRYDQNGKLYESFFFGYRGELEYELYCKKYKTNNYTRIIAYNYYFNYYAYINLKNNIQDGITKNIYGLEVYKNGKKIKGKYINIPKFLKIYYEDTKRDKIFGFKLI